MSKLIVTDNTIDRLYAEQNEVIYPIFSPNRIYYIEGATSCKHMRNGIIYNMSLIYGDEIKVLCYDIDVSEVDFYMLMGSLDYTSIIASLKDKYICISKRYVQKKMLYLKLSKTV